MPQPKIALFAILRVGTLKCGNKKQSPPCGDPEDEGPHASHGALDAFGRRQNAQRRLIRNTPPDGSKSLFLPYVYERTAGSSGFPGTWDSEKMKAGIELEIEPYEGDGIVLEYSGCRNH